MRLPTALRACMLLLLTLIPLITLFHTNDLGRWDRQRSAMAAPDEFSYLLMAQHFLHGGGLSLQADLGRDTFYPPGYPLLLALWAKLFGLTAFSAHALNTTLLCACTLVVYFLTRRLLLQFSAAEHRRFALLENAAALLALLITGIFATNWHVLETSLLIMSEPAFMLVTFVWLLLALQWPDWPTHPLQACALALLAVIAWSIRGAGIVCVATTILYPLLNWLRSRNLPARQKLLPRLAPLILVLGLPIAYQMLLALFAPEKSLTSAEDSANSYPRQLLRGILIHADPKDPHPWRWLPFDWLKHIYLVIFGHLGDFAGSFVPWLRENPDFYFRDLIGKLFAFFALAGFLFHAFRLGPRKTALAPPHAFEVLRPAGTTPSRKNPWAFWEPAPTRSSGILELYLLLYVSLYLIWPFNFARFWSPILPLMLVFAINTLQTFGAPPIHKTPPRLSFVIHHSSFIILLLLFALSAVEDAVQLGNYARRLNYVSDSIADGVRKIIHDAPDPQHTLVTGLGDDELYILAWYFSQDPHGAGYRIRVPEAHLASKNGAREHADEMLLRSADELRRQNFPHHLFFFSYFPNVDTRDTLSSLRHKMSADSIRKIYQKEIIASLWEIDLKPASTQAQTPLP